MLGQPAAAQHGHGRNPSHDTDIMASGSAAVSPRQASAGATLPSQPRHKRSLSDMLLQPFRPLWGTGGHSRRATHDVLPAGDYTTMPPSSLNSASQQHPTSNNNNNELPADAGGPAGVAAMGSDSSSLAFAQPHAPGTSMLQMTASEGEPDEQGQQVCVC